MSALFDRFGADLPPLGGIYLAAFGGGPMTLRDMTDDDVTAMFRPKLDVVSVLHKLSLNHPVRQFVLFSSISGSDRLALAGPLRGDHHLPRHLRLCAPSSRTSGHGDQLGTLEVIVRQPNRPGASGDPRLGSRADARRGRHPGSAVGHRPRRPGPLHHRRRGLEPTGHRVSHPSGTAHRGRPAANRRRQRQFIDAQNRVPAGIARLRTDAAPRSSGRSRDARRSRRRWDWLRRSCSIRRRASSNPAWIR